MLKTDRGLHFPPQLITPMFPSTLHVTSVLLIFIVVIVLNVRAVCSLCTHCDTNTHEQTDIQVSYVFWETVQR